MPHLPKPEFELDSLIFYFQGVLFLGIMSCFACIIGMMINNEIKGRKERKSK